jgi:hypothetical protein
MRWRTLDDAPAGVERIPTRRSRGAGLRLLHGAKWRSCGKKSRFPNEHVAERHARKAGERFRCLMRVYACAVCGGFHVTRAPRRDA